MKSFTAKFQIGKNGLTEGVVDSINNALKTHRQVRISVLKSCCREREKMRGFVEELREKMKLKCNFKTIGFVIVVNRLKAKGNL